MPHRRIAYALIEHGRATEWLTSIVLLVFAMTLALPGDTFAGSSFRVFRYMGLDEAMVSTPLALIASARLVALYINGNWRRSPLLRAIGASVGAGILLSLGITFGWPYFAALVSGQISVGNIAASTGAGTYTVLAGFDLLAAWRSGADLRVARRAIA